MNIFLSGFFNSLFSNMKNINWLCFQTMKSIGWLCFHETKDIKIISWKKCETIAYFICLNFSQPGADFSGGLRPEHAGALNSRGDRGGARSPSLPPTPMSPRSPLGTQSPFGSPRASPVPSHRSPSPRRFDVGFASAVANLCEQAHTIADQDRQKRYGLFFLYWCFFFFFFSDYTYKIKHPMLLPSAYLNYAF